MLQISSSLAQEMQYNQPKLLAERGHDQATVK
jgi:hypothetical protein